MHSCLTYEFRPVKTSDAALLRRWQSQPHVLQWWDPDEPSTQEELDDPRTNQWIVSHNQQPFGFIQDYKVHGWDMHPFSDLPIGSRGIDQYIGEPHFIGIGHGQGFIFAHLRRLFSAGVPAVGTDPNPENTRAIAVYRKLGFEVAGPVRSTDWGLILPMVLRQPPDMISVGGRPRTRLRQ